MQKPFVIIGPPRTGSTLLAHVLNSHPQILCTDEARPFLAAARCLKPLRSREGYETMLRPRLQGAMTSAIVSFYRHLGVTDDIVWGDKFPHYADPTWAPNILEVIDELFPGTRYVYLTRNRTDTIRSIKQSRLLLPGSSAEQTFDTIEARCEQWITDVPERTVRVSYDAPLPQRVKAVLKLLGLGSDPALEAKLRQESASPTRYSAPTSW